MTTRRKESLKMRKFGVRKELGLQKLNSESIGVVWLKTNFVMRDVLGTSENDEVVTRRIDISSFIEIGFSFVTHTLVTYTLVTHTLVTHTLIETYTFTRNVGLKKQRVKLFLRVRKRFKQKTIIILGKRK